MGAPEPSKDGALLPPEVAGMKIFFRSAWPLILAVIGSLPVLVAHRVQQHMDETGTPGSPLGSAATAAIFVLVADGVRRGLRALPGPDPGSGGGSTMEESQQAAKDRQAARSP